MAAQQEAKGHELLEQAEKRLKAFVMPLFGSKDAKFEDAAELFQKAGNAFKVAKNWEEAGKAYGRAAECHAQTASPSHEAASAYNEAASAYKKSNSVKAVEMLTRSIEQFTELGRFSQTAKHHKEIAEIYEAEENFKSAITHYEQAADFYSGEDSNSSASQCMLKVAAFSAQLGNFERAIEIYEQVATSSLESNLLKWSAKDYMQRALLCQLAIGDESAPEKVRGTLLLRAPPCCLHLTAPRFPLRARAVGRWLAGEEEVGKVRRDGPDLQRLARGQARQRHARALRGVRRGRLHADCVRVRLHLQARCVENDGAAQGEERHQGVGRFAHLREAAPGQHAAWSAGCARLLRPPPLPPPRQSFASVLATSASEGPGYPCGSAMYSLRPRVS